MMCGIFGFINSNGKNIDITTLRSARDSLIHRGPDAAGEYSDDVAYLGFRRLAILDLSPLANQPMSNSDGSTWIMFNGEIYNHIELRQELVQKGHRFYSESDTEVLLHLYDEFGVEMFRHLNGMYAIAIYDKKSSDIILCRDRLGKKPLYYWHEKDKFVFASELRALRKIPGFSNELDNESVGLFLRLGWVPSWKCIHPGVWKLPPGTWMRYEIKINKLSEPQTYWNLPPVVIDEGISEEKWLDRIEELIWDATRIRLRSDVPLGVFLSSGIDSGLVAAAAKEQTGGNLCSLTINFPDWRENEWPLAEKTAQYLGIHAFQATLFSDSLQRLPEIMAHFDEPFADSSALPTSLICEKARNSMKVALSGDGGDELFSGYENHLRAWKWRQLEMIPISLRKKIAQLGIPFSKRDSRIKRFLKRIQFPVGRLGIGSKLYPFEDWVNICVQPEYKLSDKDTARIFEEHLPQWERSLPIDQAQRIDIRFYLLDDILVKVDRMSMHHSLEVRSPLLDYRLVELALQIPPKMRIKNGNNKYLLRKLSEKYLPNEVVQTTKKGFGIPLQKWIVDNDQANSLIVDAIDRYKQTRNLFTPMGIEKLWQLTKANENFASAFFRVLAFKWWDQGMAG